MMNRRDDDDKERQAEADRQTKALAGLAVVLALAVIGFFLFQHLKAESDLEDCLLAQRSNCDQLMTR